MQLSIIFDPRLKNVDVRFNGLSLILRVTSCFSTIFIYSTFILCFLSIVFLLSNALPILERRFGSFKIILTFLLSFLLELCIVLSGIDKDFKHIFSCWQFVSISKRNLHLLASQTFLRHTICCTILPCSALTVLYDLFNTNKSSVLSISLTSCSLYIFLFYLHLFCPHLIQYMYPIPSSLLPNLIRSLVGGIVIPFTVRYLNTSSFDPFLLSCERILGFLIPSTQRTKDSKNWKHVQRHHRSSITSESNPVPTGFFFVFYPNVFISIL